MGMMDFKMINKDKRISSRITKDMFVFLEAIKQMKGFSYSKTLRLSLEHYCNFLMQEESAKNVQQTSKIISSEGSIR